MIYRLFTVIPLTFAGERSGLKQWAIILIARTDFPEQPSPMLALMAQFRKSWTLCCAPRASSEVPGSHLTLQNTIKKKIFP